METKEVREKKQAEKRARIEADLKEFHKKHGIKEK